MDQAWSASDSDYQWGFIQNLFNLSTPKLQAIDQLDGQAKAVPTQGKVPPSTANGADADAFLV